MNQKKFVGLDVYKETIAIVVINEQGEVLMQSVIATDAEIVSDFLRGLSGELYVVLEVGTQSNWLCRQISGDCQQVVLCNPRHNKLLMVGNKADLAVAEKLAQLLRLGSLKQVWQSSKNQQQLKELVRTHENLVSDCIRVMNRLKALFRSQGIKCAGTCLYHPGKRDDWLAKLVETGINFRAETLFTQLTILTALRRTAKQRMLAEARKRSDFKRLCRIPGLGLVNVSRLLAQVGSPHRFAGKRAFWSYCGLSVITRTSAEHLIINGKLKKKTKPAATRGLTRDYCHRLKNVFKMAAQKTARREPFRHYYESLLASGTRPALAQLSLARKIAATTLAIWKTQTEFEERRLTTAT